MAPAKIGNMEEFFRRDEQRLSPKSTLLFPAFAQYLTDGFIRTLMPSDGEPDDPSRKQNTSNHEIDLSPLYGRTPAQTSALRLNSHDSGNKGKLKSQQIDGQEYAEFLFEGDQIKPEFEILDRPLMIKNFLDDPYRLSVIFAFGGDRANASPQITMMNTLFLREHNRLAAIIEAANTDWDDEHVFEVARNVNIVLFVKLVVEEYINHITPFAPAIKFVADPAVAWNASWNKPNWITSEFSLLYRWHSLMPDNINWDGNDYPVFESIMNNNPLIDGGLEKAFVDMSAQPAGEIGAFNTSASILSFELKAIEQGRICELASYSDYREYVSLSRPRSFSDVSSNPKVVEFLENAYESVDDIEFYIGLFAEDLLNRSPLPELLLTMVAVDAFSQALTNPLLSEHVWKEETFTPAGWQTINETKSLRDILQRNVVGGISEDTFIGMTQPNWP
jgi:prostaglandin-endoperoxide synthase 2